MAISKPSNFGKWLIISVGSIFLIYSLFLGTLALFGTEINAKVTSYRQEYGERNETIRNQYTYLFGYEFNVEGKTFSGTGQRISNSVFLKHNNKMQMRVRYLQCCPQLNSAYDGNKTVLNLLILMFVGIGLLLISRKM
ncbi:MAG: hypothetical protein Q8S41_04670 [Lutibacter sp.]|nr:hypothetical protein [Lutibacter sp.]